MIRIVIAFFVFAVILCAWIIYDPFSGAADQPHLAETGVQAPADRLGQGVEVTRDLPAAAPTQPALREITRVIARPAIAVDDQSLAETTAGVLAGLGLDVPSPAEAAVGDVQAEVTLAVVSNIQAVRGAGQPDQITALQALVIKALQEGQTDAAIDAAVNAAALSGEVAVPDLLVTSDGRVDTSVLLASIVSEARVATGEAPPAPDPAVAADSTGVEVRIVQTAGDTQQFRFYTVNQGDSLGAIALRFYGDARYSDAIFEANRTTLSSPDRIRTGQRLVIPDVI